jgi:DNA modification methylase
MRNLKKCPECLQRFHVEWQGKSSWVYKSWSPSNTVVGQNIKAIIFWNEEGMLLIEYVVKGPTINGKVYLKTIQSFKEALILKRSLSWRQKDLLLHDNCKLRKARNVDLLSCVIHLIAPT